MKHHDVISLIDLALRFSKAKGMNDCGFQWLRQSPGRNTKKGDKVGNSLAAKKAIQIFNASNNNRIKVYKASGYDKTPRKLYVIEKDDVVRLKGFVLRGGGEKSSAAAKTVAFKILEEVEI